MSLKEDLIKKGYLYQCSCFDELSPLLEKGGVTFYVGFDCTAKSLHVGNLVTIMLARLLQKYNNRPIILVGGVTTKIGDPSGITKERPILSDAEIEDNMLGIKKSLSKFICFDRGDGGILVNNADWLSELGYINFLRRYGKYFSVSRTLSMDFFKSRLSEKRHISFSEFNYSILQSFDFLHLYRKYNCTLQIGGSDQWGNIVSGIDLIRRVEKVGSYGLTVPLLKTSSGRKMGKTEFGTVWINEDMNSPYEYFQYWRNVSDVDMIKFANLYAEFSDEEMKELERLAKSDINLAKTKFAFRLTELCHGQEAKIAVDASKSAFSRGNNLNALPSINLSEEKLKNGVFLHEVLVLANLAKSKSDAKRLIVGGGVRIDDNVVKEVKTTFYEKEFDKQRYFKVTVGKKRHVVVNFKN